MTSLQDEELTSGNEPEEDTTSLESDPDREWDPKWQPSLCGQKERTAKNVDRNSEGAKPVNTEKVSPIADKHGAEDTPSTSSHKRRRLDNSNSDTRTIKKCKVSIRISRFHL